jgi:tetratricopeptide (TPR) repeat protein
VYALGAVLAEILKIERRPPRALIAIAFKARAPRREHRYADAGALAADVERYLSDEKVEAHRERLGERLARSFRRHRTRWAVGIVAVVLSIVGTTAALVIARDARLRRQRDLFAEAVRDETRARGDLTAGRPADAIAALDESMTELAGEDGLDETRARIAMLRDRARRVQAIAEAKTAAWFLAGEERDVPALAEIARGVDAAGPRCSQVEAALPAERVDECRGTIHRLLLLEAVLEAKRGLAGILTGAAGPACVQAYASLERARQEGPTAFGDLVQSLCAKLSSKVPRPTARPMAPNATDAYMFGLTYLWMDAIPPALKGVLAPVLKDAGIDLAHPLESAIDSFREAVRLEPGEYWHSFMLAGALIAAGDYRAAGLVLEQCVALRPEYPRGLEARGLAAILEGLAQDKPEMVARGKADYERAFVLAPFDPWTHWARAGVAVTLRKPDEALVWYQSAMVLDPDGLWRTLPGTEAPGGLSTAPEAERAREVARLVLETDNANPAAWTVEAAASLVLGDLGPANAAASQAVALQGAPVLARTVRGILLLRTGDATAALPFLDGEGSLTRAARAIALEKLGRTAEARTILEMLAASAETDAEKTWAHSRLR